MHPAIRVDNLSKHYRLGTRQVGYKTLGESIVDVCSAPLRRLRRKVPPALPRESARLSGNDFWALRDVSFEVRSGEVVGIIGRNGAGKSTLLKILSRITEPTSGQVELRGRVGSLLEVGTGFHPELTGRENVYMNGSILGMSRREIMSKFDAIVAFSEIEDFLDTPVKRYSSGMYVRLAFAVAAHLEPEILIVDEVLAVGDAAFQKKCFSKMGDVATGGTTVLLVSHNLHVVRNLCRYGVLLEGGTVVASGTANSVADEYVKNTGGAPAQLCWSEADAPKSAELQLREVAVSNSDSIPASALRIDEDILITFTFDVLKNVERAYAALWITHIDGTHVLASGAVPNVTSTPDAYCGKPMPKGTYRSICRIPADFLNAGHYTVSAVLGVGSFPGQFIVRDALRFETVDTSDMRKEFQGGWLGVVRPKLPWTTTRLL